MNPLPECERVGNTWVFTDGTILPVVSGGADEGGGDVGGDAPAPAADPAPAQAAAAESPAPAAAAESPAPAAPAAAPAEADPFDGELGDDQVFSRGYVEKLRKQGQTYREQNAATAEQLATYEQVYGQYEADDRSTWFEMAQTWADDPRAGAQMMQRIANAVLNDGVTPEEATEQIIAEDSVNHEAEQGGVNLTPQQVQAMVDERLAAQEAERAQERAVDDVFNELRAAGFDPQSRDGHSVLWTANHETNGDLAKAVEIVKAERQKIIDEYVSGKASPSSRPAPSDGVLANPTPGVQTLDDAFKSANDFLKGMSSQPG